MGTGSKAAVELMGAVKDTAELLAKQSNELERLRKIEAAAKALADKMPRGEGANYFHAWPQVKELRTALGEVVR